MTRVDWVVLRRLSARLAVTYLVFFGLFCLVESLNTPKLQTLNALGGPPLALLGIILSAFASSVGALPVTVLIGTVAGVIDLQVRRELTVIQSTGISIWRAMRAPIALVLVFSALASIPGPTIIIMLNRSMLGQPASHSGPIWLEQGSGDDAYILNADRVTANPPAVYNVAVFMTGAHRERIVAPQADLQPGKWAFVDAVRYRPDVPPEPLGKLSLPTSMTLEDLRLQASGTSDLTLPELIAAASVDISRRDDRAVTLTSLYRTFTLPLLVIGSMLIAIAASAGYRRSVRYGDTVLFAIVTGFVLFVLNEMAVRAGNSGVLAPQLATLAPAVVSILIGLTALLYSQDGTI